MRVPRVSRGLVCNNYIIAEFRTNERLRAPHTYAYARAATAAYRKQIFKTSLSGRDAVSATCDFSPIVASRFVTISRYRSSSRARRPSSTWRRRSSRFIYTRARDGVSLVPNIHARIRNNTNLATCFSVVAAALLFVRRVKKKKRNETKWQKKKKTF